MNRTTVRLGALGASAALALLSAAPAQAATVAKSSATAYTIEIGGSSTDSGTVTSTHDGDGRRTTGQARPTVSVLEDQALLNAGTMAQQATTGVDDEDRGWSAACSGVAGEGATVAEVGDSACITPGRPVGLTIANLDLTGAELVEPETAAAELSALEPAMDELVEPLTAAVSEGLAPLGATGITGTAGAVEARCVTDAAGPQGMATIVDGRLTLAVGGEQVEVVDLPVHPEPNTDVLVDLDSVVDAVLEGLRTDLNNTFDGQAAPLNDVTDELREQVVDDVVAEVAAQLEPVSENLLRLTLNEQHVTGDSIAVTALRLELLPAAEQMGAETPLDARIASVECGPNGEVTPVVQRQAEPPRELPAVPTVVASGAPQHDPAAGYGAVAVAALAVVAGSAGMVGLRRSLTK